MKNLYRTVVSWIRFRFEKWFCKKSKKLKTIYVYSDDNCKIDEMGGPYEVKIKESDNDRTK